MCSSRLRIVLIGLLVSLGVSVSVRYVDNSTLKVSADRWAKIRGDGVDEVLVCNPTCVRLSGNSIYWLYRDGDAWVAGGAGVGPDYGPIPPETILHDDGRQEIRKIKFMPDLRLDQIKLGAWWPGTKDKVLVAKPK